MAKIVPAKNGGLSSKRQMLTSNETFPVWKLEDAKAKFSEVVRRAHDQGPQYVTVRGKTAVAVIDADELERLLPPRAAVVPLVEFLESLHVPGLDLERDPDVGRDVTL